jgi:hypothetical protein
MHLNSSCCESWLLPILSCTLLMRTALGWKEPSQGNASRLWPNSLLTTEIDIANDWLTGRQSLCCREGSPCGIFHTSDWRYTSADHSSVSLCSFLHSLISSS